MKKLLITNYIFTKILKLISFTTLVLSINLSTLNAQTSIGTNGTTGTNTSLGGHDIGQSFTATLTGVLKNIKVGDYGSNNGSDYTLRVFSGEGTGGSLLHTQTGTTLPKTVTDGSTYTLTSIALDAQVNITNGNVYTFVFTPALSIDLLYIMSDIYAGGALISDDNGGVLSSADMIFEVDQEEPLPVELTSFVAELNGNSVELNWATATEVNNYGFEIERKNSDNISNSLEWETISFKKGAGNSNTQKKYSYIDEYINSGKIQYRLKQIDNDGTFEYSPTIEVLNGTPEKFSLKQNYPNPFNPTTVIEFALQEQMMVNLTVYNLLGQKIATILNEVMEPGTHKKDFNAEALNSGVYFYKINIGDKFISVKKMQLIK